MNIKDALNWAFGVIVILSVFSMLGGWSLMRDAVIGVTVMYGAIYCLGFIAYWFEYLVNPRIREWRRTGN